jgi:hypothetical protein
MPRKPKTIKQYAITLLLRCVEVDADGRNIGYSYMQILSRIRKRFPIITYGGPYKGKPIQMTVKDLQKIAVHVNQDDPAARLPVRLRHKKHRKKRV